MEIGGSLKLADGLQAIVPNPDCVQRAIETILGNCYNPQDIQERLWISAQLSICDFSSSGVYDFPIDCRSREKLLSCTQQLESKPTWWTTFTGNYHHISVICQEHRHLLEAQRIVDIYRNSSSLYEAYNQELLKSFQITVRQQQQLSKQYNDTVTWMRAAEELDRHLISLRNEGANILDHLSGISNLVRSTDIAIDHTSSNLDEILTNLEEMKLSLVSHSDEMLVAERLGANIQSSMANIEAFSGGITQELGQFASLVELLSQQTQNASAELASIRVAQTQILNDLEVSVGEVTSNLEELLGCVRIVLVWISYTFSYLQQIGRYLGVLGCIGIPLMITVWTRWIKPKSPIDFYPNGSNPAVDLVFF